MNIANMEKALLAYALWKHLDCDFNIEGFLSTEYAFGVTWKAPLPLGKHGTYVWAGGVRYRFCEASTSIDCKCNRLVLTDD